MNIPSLSVIVPVYNTEKYLRRCVDSILSQSYVDFELLLIDDGSTDASPAICDEYADADSRVRVFHKPNGGVSSARNLGIDEANGTWICFADSDDIVKPGAFQALMDCAPADLVVSEFDYITVSGNSVFGQVAGDGTYSGPSVFNAVAQWSWMYWATPCNKLFSADIIHRNNLRYNTQITINEDLVFNFQYLLHVHSMVTTSAITYSYCENTASSVHRLHSFESYRTRSILLHDAISQLPDEAMANLINARYFQHHLKALPAMFSPHISPEARAEFLAWLKNLIKGNKCISRAAIPGRKNLICFLSLKFLPVRIADIIISVIY